MPPSDAKAPTAEARSLLRIANRDRTAANLRLAQADVLPNACFCAQQYVEKVTKPVLVTNGVVFRRTHDLDELAGLLEREGIGLPLRREELRLLGPFAVVFRYVDVEIPEVDCDDVARYLATVAEWLETQLMQDTAEEGS